LKGPPRSKGQNFPSSWDNLSAIAQNTAAFTPSPAWVPQKISMFSDLSFSLSVQVRQFTIPSVFE
jgi:hypothetical protein